MPAHSSGVGTAAITENLLKRKWSAAILRYFDRGISDPAEITKREPDLSAKVISERLRTMLRYGLIARFPQPPPSSKIEYRLTFRGKKILEMLDAIERLDRQLAALPRSREEIAGVNEQAVLDGPEPGPVENSAVQKIPGDTSPET